MSGTRRDLRRSRRDFAPECGRLEGRRLMAAGLGRALNAIRVKEMVADDGSVELYIAGTQRNDVVEIRDNGTTDAGNITLTFGDGRTYTSKGAVDFVQFDGRRGNDQVTYHLTGDLMASRYVVATLGAGNDRFHAELDHSMRATGELQVEAYGGAGRDDLSLVQAGPTIAGKVVPYLQGDEGNDTITYAYNGTVAAGAIVAPGLVGGAGHDTLRLDYTGQVLGQLLYYYTMDGGTGNDTVTAQVRALAGSSGKIGNGADQKSIVQGGDGDDAVTYNLVVETTPTTDSAGKDTTIRPTVFASSLGGNGRDSVRRSSNVSGDTTNESDAILS